jgi:hypothetical protein
MRTRSDTGAVHPETAILLPSSIRRGPSVWPDADDVSATKPGNVGGTHEDGRARHKAARRRHQRPRRRRRWKSSPRISSSRWSRRSRSIGPL